MDDSMLDREIENLLAVDPAPDFRARVRQRLAQEPSLRVGPIGWQLLGPLGAGGVIAAAAIAVAIIVRMDAPAPSRTELQARAIDQPIHVAMGPVIAAQVLMRAPVSTLRRRSTGTQRSSVIVHAPEAAAWRQLLAGVESGDIELPQLTRAEELPALPEAEFMLAPIVIEPLTPESQGVHP